MCCPPILTPRLFSTVRTRLEERIQEDIVISKLSLDKLGIIKKCQCVESNSTATFDVALPGRVELPSQPSEGRILSIELRELHWGKTKVFLPTTFP